MNLSLGHIRREIMTRENAWAAGGFLAVVAAAALGRALLKSGWRATTGREPPRNPDADDATWIEALVWAVVTGALVGIARALSRKGTSSVRRWWS